MFSAVSSCLIFQLNAFKSSSEYLLYDRFEIKIQLLTEGAKQTQSTEMGTIKEVFQFDFWVNCSSQKSQSNVKSDLSIGYFRLERQLENPPTSLIIPLFLHLHFKASSRVSPFLTVLSGPISSLAKLLTGSLPLHRPPMGGVRFLI